MNQGTATHLAIQAMEVALKLGAPFLLAGLGVGLLVSIFQAATQIQEQTLSFIPKLIAAAVVVIVGGPWMMNEIVAYTRDLYLSIPSLAGQ